MADMQKRRNGWLRTLIWFVVGFLVALGITSILGSGFVRTRVVSRRASCLSNMSAIGKAIAIYQGAHDGRIPPDFGYLAASEGQNPYLFLCPSTGTTMPGWSRDANLMRGEVNKATDYVFVPLPESIGYGDMLMVFELPANHRQDIANALYADLHCGVVPAPELPAAVQKTNDLLAAQRRVGP